MTAAPVGQLVALLPRHWYRRDAATVARDLLGAVLVADVGGVRRRARVVETEAYVGPHDAASHSRHGPTRRNAAMFGPPGHAYVYLVYGMHHCLNVVTGDHDGQAVLLRAAEPLGGWTARLGGPALLAASFGVTRDHDGDDLRSGPLRLHAGPAPMRIVATPRIGVAYAGDWAQAPLRFVDAASLHLSGGSRYRKGLDASAHGTPWPMPAPLPAQARPSLVKPRSAQLSPAATRSRAPPSRIRRHASAPS